MAKHEKLPVVSMVYPCTLNKPTCVHAERCLLRRGEDGEHPLKRNFVPETRTQIDQVDGLPILHVWCDTFRKLRTDAKEGG